MRKSMDYFDKLEKLFYSVSQLAVFIMMLTTSGDAIFRHVFDSPIVGAYEFTQNYLMVIVVFLSLSYVMKVKGHIKVDMLVEHLPDGLVKVLNIIFYLAAAVLMLIIGYQGALNTEEALVNHYTSAGLIAWPTWLSVIWVPIGSFLFVIRLILETIKIVMGIDTDEEAANDATETIMDDEEAAKAAMRINKEYEEASKQNVF
jgi:TRAP-type C4-dicarboxylate transport system permease small subunit